MSLNNIMKASINLWVDKIEPPDDSWTWVKHYQDAIDHIRYFSIRRASIAYELYGINSGYDVLIAMDWWCELEEIDWPLDVFIKCEDPVIRWKMIAVCEKHNVLKGKSK